MLYFILGILVGEIISLIIFVVLIFLRSLIEQKVKIIEKQVNSINPIRPKGGIFIPPSEADEIREDIIKKNKALGKDTKLSELI